MPTVARTLVDALVLHGVTHAFAVPGESYLPVLDALVDVPAVRLITCRHEAAAANMAEAYGKLTGRAGAAMVTRGPGATHAAIGVHTARQDSTPMLLFVGQVARGHQGREAFQEIDYALMFGAVTKRVVTIDRPERAAELIASALATAESGRPGPVVVVLPEDVLEQPAPPAFAPITAAPATADPHAIAEVARRLHAAERPLLLLGGPGWTDDAVADAVRLAGHQHMPVVTSWRRKDRFDNTHPLYAGELGLGSNPALLARFTDADLILAIGPRLGENPTQGYTLFDPAVPQPRLIHIHADADEIGRVYQPALGVVASTAAALRQLAALAVEHPGRREWAAGARADYVAWVQPTTVTNGVNLAAVVAHLSAKLPADAILCNGAGNFASWLHRFYQHRRLGTQLAPTSGAMGYGVPAGIAAKLLHPERDVVVLAGDGDFLMSGQELATAVQYGANVVFIVADNGQYGTIRMHQARDFPGRPSGTRLANPDFAAFARSFGAHAARVEETAAFPAALAEALGCGRPALIHLITDPAEISPGRRLAPGV